LRANTAMELKTFFAGKMPNVKAFGGTYKRLTDKTAEMLQHDLVEAKIDYVDDSKRYFDFHSLRGECASLLAASGVHPKTAQSIMRHSDINLTMNAYTHTLRGQEAKAIESLPDLSLSDRETRKATGTDDSMVDSAYKPAYKKLTKKAYFDGQRLSAIGSAEGNQNSKTGDIDDFDNTFQTADLQTKKDRLSTSDTGQKPTGRYRTRTCDPLIKSQLLCRLS